MPGKVLQYARPNDLITDVCRDGAYQCVSVVHEGDATWVSSVSGFCNVERNRANCLYAVLWANHGPQLSY